MCIRFFLHSIYLFLICMCYLAAMCGKFLKRSRLQVCIALLVVQFFLCAVGGENDTDVTCASQIKGIKTAAPHSVS